MEKYEAIISVINEKLKSDEQMLNFYKERIADLEKERAVLEKENAELKLALMN